MPQALYTACLPAVWGLISCPGDAEGENEVSVVSGPGGQSGKLCSGDSCPWGGNDGY